MSTSALRTSSQGPTDLRTFVRTTLDLGDVSLWPWSQDAARCPGMLDGIITAAADPLISVWNPLPASNRKSALRWLETREEGWECGTQASFAAMTVTDDVLLGNVTLQWVDRADGRAMISYWFLPLARGRGIATRATTAVTRWAFRSSGARRIELTHAVGNEASCRVAERCGYRPEGTLRQARRLGDGAYHDGHLHARLVADPDPAGAPAA
ncbi:GNAT family N-acetyltransferase [Streptomyces sp. NPDC057375]|uniref:GNAT family N-acetyltransferase n=1 Tax=Streptomyces sp. NPDC057375 TaxID=3346109 RepID=UPI00363ADB5D